MTVMRNGEMFIVGKEYETGETYYLTVADLTIFENVKQLPIELRLIGSTSLIQYVVSIYDFDLKNLYGKATVEQDWENAIPY